jgi:hypothetical protein
MFDQAMRALMTLAVLCGTAATNGVAAGPQGQPPAEAGRVASLQSMRWLAGQWRSEESGQLSEETWSAPHGASMVGMWRLVIDGTPRVFELLSLTVEGDDVVLRLRHFDARLVAREEKTAPLALRRAEAGEKMAVFRGAGTKGPLTITYRVEGDELVGIVQHGDEAPETYRMRRVSAS